jgi:hypothetical protein
MSKRSQTTGLPKGTPNVPNQPVSPAPGGDGSSKSQPRLQKEFESHAQREQRLQRRIILIALVTLAITGIMVLGAIIFDQVIRPNQVVASVEGQNVTLSQFQKRVRFERFVRSQQLEGIIQQFSQFMDLNELYGQLQQTPPYSTWISNFQVPDQMGLEVVDLLVDDQMIRRAATERGLTATTEQIDEQERLFVRNLAGAEFDPSLYEATAEATSESTPTATPSPTTTPTPYVSPTPSPVPTATATPAATATLVATPTATFTPLPTLTPSATPGLDEARNTYNQSRDQLFRAIRLSTGMNDGDLRAYFETLALRELLQESVSTDITDIGTFASVRHILVATEEEALDVIAAINNGESFADLARAVSTDTGSGAQGGELGWAPVTNYVKPFQDAVVAAEIGAISAPVQSEFGYHIIQVRAREERELDETQLDSARANAYGTWFEEYTTTNEGLVVRNSNWTGNVPTDPATRFDPQI